MQRKPPVIAPPRVVACKLDSKARLVLPLVVREKLSVSKGDCVVFEIEFSERDAIVVLKLSAGSARGLRRTSKNGWEGVNGK